MKKTGKFCSACKYKNPLDAAFCAYCGTPFPDEDSHNTTRRVTEEVTLPGSEPDPSLAKGTEKLATGISFYMLGDSQPMETRHGEMIILGRKTDSNIFEENLLDLSTYGAFSMGVSRRHALVQKNGNGYDIIDMDSSNGTWVNEQRLVPKQPYPLHSGARIRLGKLILLVVQH